MSTFLAQAAMAVAVAAVVGSVAATTTDADGPLPSANITVAVDWDAFLSQHSEQGG